MRDAPTVEVRDRAEWRRWLSEHHRDGTGVWLAIHKQGSTSGSLSYDEAVREALCFGLIDSTAGTLDAERYLLWMAPRKRGSGWSAVNKGRVEELIATGAMTEAGLRLIDAAKGDGSWNALDRSEALELPDDLIAAFRRHSGSRENWDAFPPSARKQILRWIDGAKRDETRRRRVEQTASLAARNERANQPRPKG